MRVPASASQARRARYCCTPQMATASVLRTPVRDTGSQRLLCVGPNNILRAGAGRRQAAPMQCHASQPAEHLHSV